MDMGQGCIQCLKGKKMTDPQGQGAAVREQGATAGCPVSLTVMRDREPWSYYDSLRAGGPLVWDEVMNGWVILDYEHCLKVESDEITFRNVYADAAPEVIEVKGGRSNITVTSGEEHGRLRRFHQKLFVPPLLESYRKNHVRPIISFLINRIAARGQADLTADLGDQIPPRVIAALLGMPWQDDELIARILHLHDDIMAYLGNRFVGSEATAKALAVSQEINEMLLPFIRSRRERPEDDFISRVWTEAPREYGDLDESTVLGICRELFLGGADTTGHGIANALHLFLTNGKLRKAVELERSSAISGLIEESMRLFGSVMYRFRVANQDITLGNQLVRKDEVLILLHSAANRDPEHYGCPHEADLTRRPINDHLAFNKGPRSCVGMGLARIEMRDTLEAVLDRLPGVRLDERAAKPSFAGLFLRSYRPLNVVWDVPGS